MAMSAVEARALIRNSGKPYYCYVLLRPDDSPFYVGVGKGRRILDHENKLRAGVNRHKKNIIAKIKVNGGAVGYEIAGWFYTWKEAGELESQLIKRHGRIDLGTGILCNLTDGGEGAFGHRKTEEVKARLSALKKGKKHSPAHCAALRAAWAADRERRLRIAKKIGEKLRGRKLAPEHKAKLHAGLKASGYTAERGAKISAALKGRSINEGWRRKMSAAKNGWKPSDAVLAAGAKWRFENATKIADARKKAWSDPDYRAKMSAALNTGRKLSKEFCEGNRARQIAKFKDRKFRERWAKAHAEGLRKPKTREKIRLAILNKWSDPVFRERMMAARKSARDNRAAKVS